MENLAVAILYLMYFALKHMYFEDRISESEDYKSYNLHFRKIVNIVGTLWAERGIRQFMNFRKWRLHTICKWSENRENPKNGICSNKIIFIYRFYLNPVLISGRRWIFFIICCCLSTSWRKASNYLLVISAVLWAWSCFKEESWFFSSNFTKIKRCSELAAVSIFLFQF